MPISLYGISESVITSFVTLPGIARPWNSIPRDVLSYLMMAAAMHISDSGAATNAEKPDRRSGRDRWYQGRKRAARAEKCANRRQSSWSISRSRPANQVTQRDGDDRYRRGRPLIRVTVEPTGSFEDTARTRRSSYIPQLAEDRNYLSLSIVTTAVWNGGELIRICHKG
jgi:hypothetical protein